MIQFCKNSLKLFLHFGASSWSINSHVFTPFYKLFQVPNSEWISQSPYVYISKFITFLLYINFKSRDLNTLHTFE